MRTLFVVVVVVGCWLLVVGCWLLVVVVVVKTPTPSHPGQLAALPTLPVGLAVQLVNRVGDGPLNEGATWGFAEKLDLLKPTTGWWQLIYVFYVQLLFGEDSPIFSPDIFSKWVETTSFVID